MNVQQHFEPSNIHQSDSILCPACSGYGSYLTGQDKHMQTCWLCRGQRYIHLKDAKVAISLDAEELAIVDTLNSAITAFARLEILHPTDYLDFGNALHTAQKIVFSRPTMRAFDTREMAAVKDDEIKAGD